ncbi:surface lipoprotein assembly modifier [Pseudotabrizicola sediminis]|nr:surface lipoprotein assembly modifier [Pseudotabrizicola sediminis]
MFRIILTCLGLLLPMAPLYADPLVRAEGLIRDGNPVAALAQLEGYQPVTEPAKERAFWALALTHMKLGQPNAALPFLEQLVARTPRRAEYRLELAAALGQLGQSERALYHIEIARSSGLPPAVDQRVAAYAKQLENPKIFSGHFSFAVVPETNAGKRTSATEVELFGLPFVINPDARARPATGLEIGVGGVASPQLAPGLRAQLGFSTQLRLFDGDAPDEVHGRLYAGLIHGHLETGQSMAQVFATRRMLDDRHYAHSTGITLEHARRLTPSTRINGTLLYEHTTYRTGADVQRRFAAIGVTHLVNPQLELSFGVRTELRDTAIARLAGRLDGIRVGGQYRFEGGLQLGIIVDYERNRFDGITPLFGVVRSDKRTMARVEMSNSQWNWKGFSPVLRLTAERQSSTIVVNEFRNLGASFGITRRF